MEKLQLYIDFDGVILDTITPTYNAIKALDKKLTEQETMDFFANYPWETVIKDENIINNSIEAIDKIIKSNKFNVSILTHVNSLNEAVIKIKYIRKHFKDITIIPCPKKVSKTKMIHTAGSILIDDYTHNLREWQKECGIGIKFSPKPKENDFPVISDLSEVINMF